MSMTPERRREVFEIALRYAVFPEDVYYLQMNLAGVTEEEANELAETMTPEEHTRAQAAGKKPKMTPQRKAEVLKLVTSFKGLPYEIGAVLTRAAGITMEELSELAFDDLPAGLTPEASIFLKLAQHLGEARETLKIAQIVLKGANSDPLSIAVVGDMLENLKTLIDCFKARAEGKPGITVQWQQCDLQDLANQHGMNAKTEIKEVTR